MPTNAVHGRALELPAAVRYPRGQGPGVAIEQDMQRTADRQVAAAS